MRAALWVNHATPSDISRGGRTNEPGLLHEMRVLARQRPRFGSGRIYRLLVVIDEYTRECLAIEVGRSFTAQDVMGVLQYLFAVRGTPEHLRSDNLRSDNLRSDNLRSDNGPEFISKVICRWLKEADVKTLFIAEGSPWENGYVESFNGTLRDELLNREIFLSFEEACWVIDRWRLDYNHHRIHRSLDYQTPAAYAAGCVLPGSATPQPPEHNQITYPDSLTQPGAKTGDSHSVAMKTPTDWNLGIAGESNTTFNLLQESHD